MEGPLQLLDSGKAPEMFVILFDDMLLITRKKKGLSKKVGITTFLFKSSRQFLLSSSTSFVENIQIFLTQWTKTLDTFPVRQDHGCPSLHRSCLFRLGDCAIKPARIQSRSQLELDIEFIYPVEHINIEYFVPSTYLCCFVLECCLKSFKWGNCLCLCSWSQPIQYKSRHKLILYSSTLFFIQLGLFHFCDGICCEKDEKEFENHDC